MAVLRIWLLIAGCWFFQFLFLPLFPLLRVLVDPLFILLVFIGLHAKQGRFLWAVGFGLGLAKDLCGGGLFGASACSFALIGWILGVLQTAVEREDPFLQGAWVAALTLVQWFSYGFILRFSNPALAWNPWVWFYLPLATAAGVLIAFRGFPPLRKFLKIRQREHIQLYVSET